MERERERYIPTRLTAWNTKRGNAEVTSPYSFCKIWLSSLQLRLQNGNKNPFADAGSSVFWKDLVIPRKGQIPSVAQLLRRYITCAEPSPRKRAAARAVQAASRMHQQKLQSLKIVKQGGRDRDGWERG